MKIKNNKYRFWEIDFLRGIAIILMIFFHILYDLNYFLDFSYELNQGLYLYIGRLSAILFILIAGISLKISYSRDSKTLSKKDIRLKLIKRGLKIIFLGLIISFVTWLYLPQGFIIFGVLHFIGTSIIVWILFERFKNYNFIFGLVFIIIGFYIRTLNFDSIFLLPFGFIPENFWTVDYFPIFPWFGLILIGSVFGNIIFPNFKRRFYVPDISNNYLINIFCFLGRNSLIIYFIHQPIIIGIILLFFS